MNILLHEWEERCQELATTAQNRWPQFKIQASSISVNVEGDLDISSTLMTRTDGDTPIWRMGSCPCIMGGVSQVIAATEHLSQMAHLGAWLEAQTINTRIWFSKAPCDFCSGKGEIGVRGTPCKHCAGAGKRSKPTA